MQATTRDRGFTLSELLISLAVMAILTAATLPACNELRRKTELGWAARKVGGLLLRCRAMAILHRRTTGVVFEREDAGEWRCFLAEDGDGDGIRRDDIDAGRDPRLGEIVDLDIGHASLGILAGLEVPDPSGGGSLGGDLRDPIRAGRGDIISFTPRGTARPASVYLTDHHRRMRVLRVIGSTGRIRTLEWQLGWPTWRRVST